jgi:flagellar biosynthesis protein FliR
VAPYATTAVVWAAALVFARVGALFMLIPGIGETYVPMNVRLILALLLSLCLWSIALPSLPTLPTDLGDMTGDIVKELLIGGMMGALLQMFTAALNTAGELISLQTTLSFAQTTNPAEAQPTASVSTFLMLVGMTLVFDTDLHQLFIAAIAHSYTLFPDTKALPLNDAAVLATQTIAKTFALAVQMAAPVIVFSLVFNIASGLIGRAMPQFQVFFVATPLNLLLGLSIFALSLGAIGLVWVRGFESFIGVFT